MNRYTECEDIHMHLRIRKRFNEKVVLLIFILYIFVCMLFNVTRDFGKSFERSGSKA